MSKIIRISGDALKVLQQINEAIKLRETVEKMRISENVVIVLQDHERDVTELQACANLVTDAGDLYYAQMCAGETPTSSWVGMRLGTGAGVPDKSSSDCSTFFGVGKNTSATYPKTNDGDGSNSGSGLDIVTWKADWALGENNGSSMTNGAIVDDITSPTEALSHFTFTPFTKLISQTLAVFVNHRMNGV